MMLPLVVCICNPAKGALIYHQRGVFIQFIYQSGVWRYHVFDEQYRVPHAF